MTNKKTAYTGGTVRGGGNRKHHSQSTTTRAAGQPIYTPSGKVAGTVLDGVFRKCARGSAHMLKRPRLAWALDVDVLDQLRALDVHRVEVLDTETSKTYSVSLGHFARNCGKPFDRGFGVQVALTLPYWHVDGQAGPDAERDPDAPRQLPLFAEVGT